jgi:outer membrane biogenesis lipoprotein LolB
MKNQTVRASAATIALAALLTLCLTGCSSSTPSAAQETEAQKTQRQANVQKHKDAADNVQ